MKNNMRYVNKLKSSTAKTKEKVSDVYHSLDKNDRQLKETTGKGWLHTHTEKSSDFVGSVIGTPVRYIGQKTKIPYIEELGDTLHGATKFSGSIVGQVGQGTWKTVQGAVKRNQVDFFEGIGEYTSVTGRTIKAVYKSTAFTVKNSGSIVHGVYSKDYHKAVTGLKGVGKVVIVGAVAITVFDFAEGDDVSAAETGDFLLTPNSELDGQLHPETGVLYEAQTIELGNGSEVVGVFPVFESIAEVELPSSLYESSDYSHFSYANQELTEMVNNNASLSSQFTAEQLEQLYAGETPDGYTWHHHEELGKLQLIDEEIHAQSSHSGGRFIWGGGTYAR